MAHGRMTSEKRFSKWKSVIRVAEKRRRSFFEGEGDGYPPGCDFAIDVYRGSTRPAGWHEEDMWWHTGKLTSAVRAAIPTLMYANPKFRVFPKARDIMDGADVAYARAKAKELWLNHVWSETNGNQHTRNAINNAFFSIGVIKCGYLPTFQDSEDRGEWKRDDDGNYVLGPDGDPVLARGKVLTDEDGEVIRDEYGIPVLDPGTLTKEKWFMEVADARMLLFDTDGGPDFFQHRYIIEEWVRPLDEVKDDPRYKQSVRKNLTASDITRAGDGHRRRGQWDVADPSVGDKDKSDIEGEEPMLRGYDVYDFVGRRYMVIPECGTGDQNQDFLLDTKMPKGMEHGPFRFLKFTEDVGTEWYPIPDAINMALQNQFYDLTQTQEAIHRGHTKSRYLEEEGAFDGQGANAEEERAKLAHGPDGTLIKVTSIGKIQPMTKAYLDPSFAGATQKIAMDFNEVGGMPGEMRGVADSETATQASILATGAEIRNNDRRDNQVQTFLCEIGRALLISGQENAELDSYVMDYITAETGVPAFRPVKLTPEELLGEFEVTVEIGSTMNKADPRVNAQIAEFVKTVSQNPWIAQSQLLISRWLDGLNLDPVIAGELAKFAAQFVQMQNAPQQGAMTPATQNIADTVLGGLGNAAAGASTGATVN